MKDTKYKCPFIIVCPLPSCHGVDYNSKDCIYSCEYCAKEPFKCDGWGPVAGKCMHNPLGHFVSKVCKSKKVNK